MSFPVLVPIIMKFYQQIFAVRRSKLVKFGEEIIFIDRDMASKFDDIISSSKMSELLSNFVDFLTLL